MKKQTMSLLIAGLLLAIVLLSSCTPSSIVPKDGYWLGELEDGKPFRVHIVEGKIISLQFDGGNQLIIGNSNVTPVSVTCAWQDANDPISVQIDGTFSYSKYGRKIWGSFSSSRKGHIYYEASSCTGSLIDGRIVTAKGNISVDVDIKFDSN